VLIDMGSYDQALGHLENAKRSFIKTGDTAAAAKADATIGIVYWYRGELERAIACLERLAPVYQRLGDRVSLSNLYNNLGNAWGDRGDHQKAERYYRDQIAICRECGHLDGLQRGLGNLGILHYLAGEYPAALALYQEKLSISQQMGNQKSISIAIGNIGLLYSDQGRFSEALGCYHQKQVICRLLDDPLELAIVTGNIGVVRQRQGDDAAALGNYLTTIQQLRELGAKYHLAEFLFRAADAQLRLNRRDEAAALCREAKTVAGEMHQDEAAVRATVIECQLRHRADPDGAIRKLQSIIAGTGEDRQRAYLYLELYRLTRDSEHRRIALELNRALFAITPFIEYRQAIEFMEQQ
jgi:tetratricopeptide (TPR) repeat protein